MRTSSGPIFQPCVGMRASIWFRSHVRTIASPSSTSTRRSALPGTLKLFFHSSAKLGDPHAASRTKHRAGLLRMLHSFAKHQDTLAGHETFTRLLAQTYPESVSTP